MAEGVRGRFGPVLGLVAAVALLSALPAPAQAAKRVALVIGNVDYDHVPDLVNPKKDAADVGAALSRLGFAVTSLENTSHTELFQGLGKFATAAHGSEIAVVFYAGHGVEVDKRNYLVPVGAELATDVAVEYEAVPLERVIGSVGGASTLGLVILDACRDNPFPMESTDPTRSISRRGLTQVEPKAERRKSMMVAYSAAEGTKALDGKAGENSPYAKALLDYLEKPGLDVSDLFINVRNTVGESSGWKQVPYASTGAMAGKVYLAGEPPPPPDPKDEGTSTAGEGTEPRPIPLPLGDAARDYEAAERLADRLEDPAPLRVFIKKYPDGIYADYAREWIARFVEAGAGARAAPEPACTGEGGEAACWTEVSNQPGCWIWDPHPLIAKTITWSGGCTNSKASGRGKEVWRYPLGREWRVNEGEGPYVDGKRHGNWVERHADGMVDEGPFVDGKRHGDWVFRYANGTVEEGPFVDGKRHGDWVFRYANGTVSEGPFVDDQQHGDWVVRQADGTVAEGPFVDGKLHGDWVVRQADGTVEEGPYVDGKRHGDWVERHADGTVEEGPYVDGKRHGDWVLRNADGMVVVGPYVDGKPHGRWVRGKREARHSTCLVMEVKNDEFADSDETCTRDERAAIDALLLVEAPTAPSHEEAERVEMGLGLERKAQRLVQMGLAAAGHAPGATDGILGRRTRAALRAWQESVGLEVTGYLTNEQSEGLAALGAAREAREAMEGRAEISSPDGRHYKGAVGADLEPHGLGVGSWPDGDGYEGEWRDGRPYGLGVWTNADGGYFAGSTHEGGMGAGFFSIPGTNQVRPIRNGQ